MRLKRVVNEGSTRWLKKPTRLQTSSFLTRFVFNFYTFPLCCRDLKKRMQFDRDKVKSASKRSGEKYPFLYIFVSILSAPCGIHIACCHTSSAVATALCKKNENEFWQLFTRKIA